MKAQQSSSKEQRNQSNSNINLSKEDVNLPKINKLKTKRMASVDDDDYGQEDFDREEKGVPKGKSQAELIRGKDVGKKRLASQN